MGLVDKLLELLPVAYRRDAVVAIVTVGLASVWFHLETRIDTAYAASVTTQQLQQQLVEAQKKQAVTDAKIDAVVSNQAGMKSEVDALVQGLLANNQPRAPQPRPKPQ